MDKADEYLRDAAECIHLAARQTSIEHKARLLQMAEAWIYLAYRPRRKRPVRSPQVPSLKTAGRNKQQGKRPNSDEPSALAAESERTSRPAGAWQPAPAARPAAGVSMPSTRELGATADAWEPAGRQLSSAFLLQLEESLLPAGRRMIAPLGGVSASREADSGSPVLV